MDELPYALEGTMTDIFIFLWPLAIDVSTDKGTTGSLIHSYNYLHQQLFAVRYEITIFAQ